MGVCVWLIALETRVRMLQRASPAQRQRTGVGEEELSEMVTQVSSLAQQIEQNVSSYEVSFGESFSVVLQENSNLVLSHPPPGK